MEIREEIWDRFRDHSATESDLKAIRQYGIDERAAKPEILPEPEFDEWLDSLIWQLERMELVDGKEPLMRDALAVLAELEKE